MFTKCGDNTRFVSCVPSEQRTKSSTTRTLLICKTSHQTPTLRCLRTSDCRTPACSLKSCSVAMFWWCWVIQFLEAMLHIKGFRSDRNHPGEKSFWTCTLAFWCKSPGAIMWIIQLYLICFYIRSACTIVKPIVKTHCILQCRARNHTGHCSMPCLLFSS